MITRSRSIHRWPHYPVGCRFTVGACPPLGDPMCRIIQRYVLGTRWETSILNCRIWCFGPGHCCMSYAMSCIPYLPRPNSSSAHYAKPTARHQNYFFTPSVPSFSSTGPTNWRDNIACRPKRERLKFAIRIRVGVVANRTCLPGFRRTGQRREDYKSEACLSNLDAGI